MLVEGRVAGLGREEGEHLLGEGEAGGGIGDGGESAGELGVEVAGENGGEIGGIDVAELGASGGDVLEGGGGLAGERKLVDAVDELGRHVASIPFRRC